LLSLTIQTTCPVTEQEQQQIFGQWLDGHKGLIFKIVRGYGYTAMEQEDLFQEITIQVWRSIPGFRHESSATTWIYRIALNTAIRWSGKEKKHRNMNGEMGNLPEILSSHSTPVDERLNWLYKAIHQLNEIDRSLILLQLDGFSYKEMATVLGISESNVGVKINRIKQQLISQSKK
jgi:RNA polymerase sigma-70 factor (ECF subfamily)